MLERVRVRVPGPVPRAPGLVQPQQLRLLRELVPARQLRGLELAQAQAQAQGQEVVSTAMAVG